MAIEILYLKWTMNQSIIQTKNAMIAIEVVIFIVGNFLIYFSFCTLLKAALIEFILIESSQSIKKTNINIAIWGVNIRN